MTDYQYLPRLHEAHLVAMLGRHPAVVLHGARQTGKTTLCRAAAFGRGRRYLTLDDLQQRALARDDPGALFLGSERVTVDEVQRAPELLSAVKQRIDDGRTPGAFLLTGSANLLLMRAVTESLAGRAIIVELPGLLWPEIEGAGFGGLLTRLLAAGTLEEALQALPPAPPRPRRPLEDAILRGGYPVASLHDDAAFRTEWFDGYVQTYLERDLRQLSAIDNVVEFRRLMGLCAARNGQLLNAVSLADGLQVSQATVRRYLHLLEVSFQLLRVPAYAINRGRRVIKAPKLYWRDTGLAAHLAGVSSRAELNRMGAWGAWLENWVAVHLQVFASLQTPRAAVSHWRTSDGREVDLVLEQRGRLLPIEVKATAHPRPADLRGLHAFQDTFPDEAPFGLVICGCDAPAALSRRILAVPFETALLT